MAIKSSFDLNNIGWGPAGRPREGRSKTPEVVVMCPFDGLLFFLQSFAAPVRCKESKNLGKTNIASCCCACGVGAVATALPLMIDHIFKKNVRNEKDRGAGVGWFPSKTLELVGGRFLFLSRNPRLGTAAQEGKSLSEAKDSSKVSRGCHFISLPGRA